MTILNLLALIFRVVTGECRGGRALTNAAIQLCAAVLLIGVPAGLWYGAPYAVREYLALKTSLDNIERTLELRAIADDAKDAEQDAALARIEAAQRGQTDRLDRLSDRVSRMEGRRTERQGR